MIKTSLFGKTAAGEDVLAFTLQDGRARVTILNLGGIIQSVLFPDINGNLVDVVCGYNDVAGYENNGGYLGALIGRYGNRIGGGRLIIDGKGYQLYLNDRGNHLHGGKEGFNKKIWAHEIRDDELILTLTSPDGDEHYPGNLNVKVTYSFMGGELKIHYEAETDKPTAINLTNHAYFNLNGEANGDVLNHVLWLDCDTVVPTNDTMIPVGGFRAVKGTPFDFNVPKKIGQDIAADDIDIKQGNGYDHCHILKTRGKKYAMYAIATGDKTGIQMYCYTDMPAVHFYAGNGMHYEGKSRKYTAHSGFCLETEAIPNNVNVPEYDAFGSSILRPGEKYEFTSAYKFVD